MHWTFFMRRAQRPRNSVTPFPSRLLARRSDPAWHDRLLASRRGGRATSVVIDDRSRSVFLECVVSGRPLALTLCCPASPSRCTLGQLLGRGTAHASMMCTNWHQQLQLRQLWQNCNCCTVATVVPSVRGPQSASASRQQRAARQRLGSSSITAASAATQANGMPRKWVFSAAHEKQHMVA